MTDAPLSEQYLDTARSALASRVTELRKATKMSQREASERAGITVRTWGRIEKGSLSPRLDSLLRVQNALELDSMDALFAPTVRDLFAADSLDHN